MYWECPEVDQFWNVVSFTLYNLLHIQCCRRLLNLNDTSSLKVPHVKLPTVFAGLTAAKKTKQKNSHKVETFTFIVQDNMERK